MPQSNFVLLAILDGWGLARPGPGNAVFLAKTPTMDRLWSTCPHTELVCSGRRVGLPQGIMGNSEVGHLNLGAGRVVYQDISRIDRAIENGDFFKNHALLDLIDRVKAAGRALHLLGLVSNGDVHAALDHLYALVDLARKHGLKKVFLHAFTDGRDTPPDSGLVFIQTVEEELRQRGSGQISTLGGRYFGMDRDKRWDRIEKHYSALVRGRGRTAADPVKAMEAAYAAGETDEFITPTVIVDSQGRPLGPIQEGDGVVFFNFRADRARELTAALTKPGFDGFDVSDRPGLSGFVTMTLYGEHLGLPAAFGPEHPENILGQVVSRANLRQLRIAETEKYAHVTYFFNGGLEEPFPGEDRILIPSPREVATYDLKPEMSARQVTEAVLPKIAGGDYSLIVLNFANGDMVGHTGVLQAAVEACQVVDECLGRIEPAVIQRGGRLVVTADHGNAEQMIDSQGRPHTAHSLDNPVPFIVAGAGELELAAGGALCDVAPTVLDLLGLMKPPEMTGRSLIVKSGGPNR